MPENFGDETQIPVLIVGGGPVGLALAADLGWRGIPCRLIEQTDGVITTPKMNEVNVRTMEFCRRWGIAQAVHDCPFPSDYSMDIVFVTNMSGYELGRMPRPAKGETKPGPNSPANLTICSQKWFDPILLDLARSFPCVDVRHHCRMDSFEVGSDGVTAQLVNVKTGEKETVRARYLAACDGAMSPVRRKLGIGLSGDEVISRPLHLFFRTPDLCKQMDIAEGTFFLAVDRDGMWANIRVIDPVEGLWRLMALDSPGNLQAEDIDKQGLLRRALGRDIDVEWVGASIWTRRGVVADRYVDGPVFMLGDAVHQLSPTGALGMNTGIGDAVDLGWKLAAAIQGWGGKSLLQSYETERRPVGLRNVYMATQFYESHVEFGEGVSAIEDDTPEGAQMRRDVGPKMTHEVSRMFRTAGLQLGYRYESSPVCVSDGTPALSDDPENYIATARPGSRAPHAWLVDGRSILDLFGREFVLLRLGADAPATDALESAAAQAKMPLQTQSIEDAAIAKLYERKLVLVRPDGHVAWRGDELPAAPDKLIARVCGL